MQKLVSIIIPCYNEEKTITKLLDSLIIQTYPKSKIEVIISDGMSTDLTREKIKIFSDKNKILNIKIIDNVDRTIPAALNKAIKISNGEIIVRLDAHSVPNTEYVEHCVNLLDSNFGDVVGGVWEIKPNVNNIIATSISIAASSFIGVGDAKYRLNPKAGKVETVPFGAFKKNLIDKIGLFDETLLTNEDYEFNNRVILNGGIIWLDPKIRSIYFSRSNLKDLSKQYFRYGFWKFKMLKRNPFSIKLRQAIPPLFLVLIFLAFVFSSISVLVKTFLFSSLIIYFTLLLFVGIKNSIKRLNLLYIIYIPISIACMHFSWGLGFLWSIFKK